MSILLMEPKERTPVCDHAETEYLGSDGPAHFHRCRGCQRVIIFQGDQRWMLRPAAST